MERQARSMTEETTPPSGGETLPRWHETLHASWTRFDTSAGPIFLRDHCPASFVEHLRVERGLHTFARVPEHQRLLTIAQQPANALTLAFTPRGKIIGQVTLVPADGWWQGLKHIYEISIEVSSSWRKLGIARQLMAITLRQDAIEEVIILGLGLCWHWDVEHLGLHPIGYRVLLARAASAYGFREYLTSEPNVNAHPANILLARIGKRVEQETINQFVFRLLQSGTLPGVSSEKELLCQIPEEVTTNEVEQLGEKGSPI